MGAREDIILALQTLGKPSHFNEIAKKIKDISGKEYQDLGTTCADLTIGGNTSSTYKDSKKCLVRVERGVYYLAPDYK